MNKKSTLILLSILHICILGICILTIYNNKHSGITIAHVSSDTRTVVTQTEPETLTEPESDTAPTPETEIETEMETETETETESETESEIETKTEPETEIETKTEPESELPAQTEIAPETKPAALYAFHFIGTHKNLNIRNAPSSKAKIIGKIPVGGCGKVLELTNEYWVLAEYNGIIGYCSRHWIELQKITE